MNWGKMMNPYIEILRPGNVIMAVIAIVLVAIVDHSISIPIILAMFTVFFEISAGNVINDYFDYKIDLINKPHRPIPSGRISPKTGRNYAYLLFVLGTVCGFLISYINKDWTAFIIVIIADIILYVYARDLKSTPLIGNLTVGFMTGLCFAFGGYAINNPQIIATSWFLGFFAFVMTTAREITKDIEDMEGDKAEGARTFPILYGAKLSAAIAFALIIIDCALCPLLYFHHVFSIVYLAIMVVAVIIFLYSGVLIIRNQDEKTAAKASKFLKIGILMAFIAFALGSF